MQILFYAPLDFTHLGWKQSDAVVKPALAYDNLGVKPWVWRTFIMAACSGKLSESPFSHGILGGIPTIS